MAELLEHVAIRMEEAFNSRPRDERMGIAHSSARCLYELVARAEQVSGIDLSKVIAEFILCEVEQALEKRKREHLLEAQSIVRGCVATAERHLREAMQKANTLADRLVE